MLRRFRRAELFSVPASGRTVGDAHNNAMCEWFGIRECELRLARADARV
jgi:hypothetical protein